MRALDYFDKNSICTELKSNSKNEAIKELADLIRDNKNISDFDKFVGDVFSRENLKTTGIGDGVAIPHARTDAVKKIIIAFGISKTGVDFQSMDKNPSNIIFLIGIPTEHIDDYLKVLGHLTRLLKHEDMRQSLLKAKDKEEIIRIFKQAEK